MRIAVGIRELQSFIIKTVAEIANPVLVLLLSWSLIFIEYSEIWKVVVVIPVSMNGPNMLSNCKIISLVSAILKII